MPAANKGTTCRFNLTCHGPSTVFGTKPGSSFRRAATAAHDPRSTIDRPSIDHAFTLRASTIDVQSTLHRAWRLSYKLLDMYGRVDIQGIGVAQQVWHSRCSPFTYRVRGCPKFLPSPRPMNMTSAASPASLPARPSRCGPEIAA